VHITLIPKLMDYSESNKKKVLDILDEQIKTYKQTLLGINGQTSHQHEEYVEIAIRVRDFMIRKYGSASATQVAIDPAHRTPTKDEIVLFESEFDKMVKERDGKPNPAYDPKTIEEYKKAKETAMKMNLEARKKKE